MRLRILPLVLATLAASPALADETPAPADAPATDPSPVEPPTEAPSPPDDAVASPVPEDETLIKQNKSGQKKGKKKKKGKPGLVQVSGYLNMVYKMRVERSGDGTKDPATFRLSKATVRFRGRVNHYVGYTIEIDPRSPTVEGVLRDGYISLRHLVPGHEIRIGQQKVPFGYENWLSSTRQYFLRRSELSEGLARGVTHRDIGIGLVGKLKLAPGLRLENAIALVNGAGFGVQQDDTHRKNLWGRIGIRYKSESLGLVIHAGVSGAIGDQFEPEDPGPPLVPASTFSFKRIAGDLEIDHRYGFLAVEYGTSWDKPAGGSSEQSSAFLITLAGKTPWHVGPAVRYDASDAEGFTRYTIGGYYGEPKAKFRVLADYEIYEDDFGKNDGRFGVEGIVVF